MHLIVRSSLAYKFLVLPIALVTMFVGAFQLRKAPVDVLPEFTPPYVEIQTEALGLSASEVEQLITAPLEADLLNQVAWIDQIRSESVPGLSSIELIFEPGTNILDARQMVQERLMLAGDMPNVSKPPNILQPLSSANRVMMIGLSSTELSLIEQSVLARWKVKPRLLGVPGVANVVIWGQRERQLQVHVDPERLRANGIPLSKVIRTTGNALWVSPLSFLEASTPGSGGFVESPNQRFGVQHVSPITTSDALSKVTLEDASGKVLRLGDVADVVEDHQPLIGDAITNDQPGLMLVIEKFPGFNTIDVTNGVEEALKALAPGMPGVKTDTTIYRPATFIEAAVGNLSLGLAAGLVLFVLLLSLLLFDWRAALISIVVIPLSLVVAALILYAAGASLNLVTLAGLVIALPILIDDVITDADAVRRRLRKARQDNVDTPRPTLVADAALAVRGPLVYATLIAVLAAVPFFFIGGMDGVFFGQLGMAYVLAVLASFVAALTITPILVLVLVRGKSLERRETPVMRGLKRVHKGLVSRLFGRLVLTGAVAVLIVVAGLIALPGLLAGKPTLPALQDRALLVQWEGVPGTSRAEIDRITQRASVELRALPGVGNVGAHVGRGVASDQVVNINSGQLWVGLDKTADYAATVASVRAVVQGYPGLSSRVTTYPEARISEVFAESERILVVRIYGQDPEVLRAKAQEVRELLTKVDGVVDPRVDMPAEEPTVEVEVNLNAAQVHGVKPGDVRRAAATLLSGVEVGSIFEEQKVFDVVVWGKPETRHSLSNIRDLLVDTPSGGHVRLGDVADVRIKPHPVVIKRASVSRRLDVVAQVSGRDVSAVAVEVEEKIRKLSFPLETHAEVLGEHAKRQDAQTRTIAWAIAAAIVIFLLFQAAFGSWRLATLLFVTLPVALAGGALAAVIDGGLTTLGSLAGLIAVLAMAARQGIVLIRHFQWLEREEGETFGPELVLRGTRERLTPTLVTVLAAAVVLLPFAVLGQLPGYELAHPLAVVILGGLVTSTVWSMFLLPALYLRFAAPRSTESVQGGSDVAPAQ